MKRAHGALKDDLSKSMPHDEWQAMDGRYKTLIPGRTMPPASSLPSGLRGAITTDIITAAVKVYTLSKL